MTKDTEALSAPCTKNKLQCGVHLCLCFCVIETLKAVNESIWGSLRLIAWKVPLWLYWTTPTRVPEETNGCINLMHFSSWQSLKILALHFSNSTCLCLGIFGKRSQPVDCVDDKVLLQGEVGETHRLRAIDNEDNVQGSTTFLTIWTKKPPKTRKNAILS